MISELGPKLLHIAPQLAAGVAPPESVGSMERWLSTIDQTVFALAAVFAFLAVAWWVARSRRDPLGASPSRPNRLGGDSLALAVLVYLSAAMVMGAIGQAVSGDTEGAVARVIAGSGAQIAGIAICFVIAADRFDGGLRRFCVGARAPVGSVVSLTIVGTVLAVAVCPLVLEGSIWVVHRFAPGHEFPTHPTITALHGEARSLGVRLALWFSAVVVAPMAEEVFFRGLLQTMLVNVLRCRWTAIAVASVVFATVHFSQPQAIPALIALAFLMGYAYERTGSLLPSMLIHGLFNLKTLVWDALAATPA